MPAVVVPFAGGDTRTAIQNAFDAASHGDTVQLEAGRVYEVSSLTTTRDVKFTTPTRVALFVPSGVTFEGNGSTIRLQNNQDAYILGNKAITTNSGSGPTGKDSDITVKNLVLDGNKANQATGGTAQVEEFGCYVFQAVNRLVLRNVHVKNAQSFGGNVFNITDGVFDNLTAVDIRGEAFTFGLSVQGGVELKLFNCIINNVSAVRCDQGFTYPEPRTDSQANPGIFNVVNCASGNFTADNCGGGWKVEGQSRDSSFGRFVWQGGSNNTSNCGTKIQGFTGGRCRGITIGSVVTTDADGEALRFTQCDFCTVGSVYARNCGQVQNQNILMDDARGNHIGSAVVEDDAAGNGVGVFLGIRAVTSASIDTLRCRNINGPAVQLQVANASLSIGRIYMLDSGTQVINQLISSCRTVIHSIMSTTTVSNNAGGGTLVVTDTQQNIT